MCNNHCLPIQNNSKDGIDCIVFDIDIVLLSVEYKNKARP